MASTVQHMHPVAQVPGGLGVLRRLAVATGVDRLIPPHPAPGLSCGRGVAARGLAMLAGPQALDKVGRRLEAGGLWTRLQPGLTRAALHDDRLGPLLDALFAAHLHKVCGAMALKALAGEAIPPPWRQQETTTMALAGAEADEPQPPGAPRPASGQSPDGRDARKPVLLSLGGSGDGGSPRRGGRRAGHRSDSVATPVAIAAGRACGVEGGRGRVAARKAARRRPLGGWLEHKSALVPLVPRTGAVRQERAAGGRAPPPLPRVVETPGRTQHEVPRRWHGQRGLRQGEVADRDGRVAQEAWRFVGGHARQRAP